MLQQRLRLGSCGSRHAAAGLQDAAAAARCTLPVSRCTVARCTQSAQWVSFALSLGRFAEFVMVLLLFCYFIHCFINCICNLRPIVAAASDHQIDCASACWLLLLVLLLGLIWPNLWLHLTLLTAKDLCLWLEIIIWELKNAEMSIVIKYDKNAALTLIFGSAFPLKSYIKLIFGIHFVKTNYT